MLLSCSHFGGGLTSIVFPGCTRSFVGSVVGCDGRVGSGGAVNGSGACCCRFGSGCAVVPAVLGNVENFGTLCGSAGDFRSYGRGGIGVLSLSVFFFESSYSPVRDCLCQSMLLRTCVLDFC
eukprot:3328516-Amphidinium_carterae.1